MHTRRKDGRDTDKERNIYLLVHSQSQGMDFLVAEVQALAESSTDFPGARIQNGAPET